MNYPLSVLLSPVKRTLVSSPCLLRSVPQRFLATTATTCDTALPSTHTHLFKGASRASVSAGHCRTKFLPSITAVVTQANMASLSAHQRKHKVTVIGSGNWYGNVF
jgi:hypothetical protein